MKGRKLVLFLLLIFCVSLSYGMTRGELEDAVRKKIDDVRVSGVVSMPKWADSDLDTRIENAQIAIARRTNCIEKSTYITTTADLREYSMPSDYLSLYRVSYAYNASTASYHPLYAQTFKGLDADSENWENEAAGDPEEYTFWKGQITLRNPPSASYDGTNFLKVQYYALPASLSSDSSIPFDSLSFMYPYHMLIVYYVAAECLADEKKITEANRWQTLYEQGIALMITELNTKPGWQPDFKMPNFQ